MKRESVATVLCEIYIDINMHETTNFIIRDVKTNKIKTHTINANGFLDILDELPQFIHARYTRVIIDGYYLFDPIKSFIDEIYNLFIKACEPITTEDLMLEMVEIRIASRKEIEYYKEILDEHISNK